MAGLLNPYLWERATAAGARRGAVRAGLSLAVSAGVLGGAAALVPATAHAATDDDVFGTPVEAAFPLDDGEVPDPFVLTASGTGGALPEPTWAPTWDVESPDLPAADELSRNPTDAMDVALDGDATPGAQSIPVPGADLATVPGDVAQWDVAPGDVAPGDVAATVPGRGEPGSSPEASAGFAPSSPVVVDDGAPEPSWSAAQVDPAPVEGAAPVAFPDAGAVDPVVPPEATFTFGAVDGADPVAAPQTAGARGGAPVSDVPTGVVPAGDPGVLLARSRPSAPPESCHVYTVDGPVDPPIHGHTVSMSAELCTDGTRVTRVEPADLQLHRTSWDAPFGWSVRLGTSAPPDQVNGATVIEGTAILRWRSPIPSPFAPEDWRRADRRLEVRPDGSCRGWLVTVDRPGDTVRRDRAEQPAECVRRTR